LNQQQSISSFGQPMRLTRYQFREAIRSGRGRAVQHVMSFGVEGIEDLIRDAVMRDYRTCNWTEDSRARYLLAILDAGGLTASYESFLIQRSRRARNRRDHGQALDLLARLAQRGSLSARAGIRSTVEANLRSKSDLWTLDIIIDSEGITGLTWLLEHPLAPHDLEWWAPITYWVEDLEKEVGKRAVRTALRRVAKNSDRARERLKALEIPAAPAKRRKEDKVLPFDEWFSELKALPRDSAEFRQRSIRAWHWARSTSDEERRKAINVLSEEGDTALLVPLARVVNGLEFDPTNLLERASQEDVKIAYQRLWGLKDLKHSSIREFALQRLGIPCLADIVIRFLDVNSGPRDATRIFAALRRMRFSRDDWHGIGMEIVKFYRDHRFVADGRALRLLYERNPCTECRERHLAEMIRRHEATRSDLEEALHDASWRTRQLAKKELARLDRRTASTPLLDETSA
jgi:hypothetical protein